MIQYAGWDDEEIHPGESVGHDVDSHAVSDFMVSLQIKWYRDVYTWTTANTDINVDDHFRLFMVPGMRHCQVCGRQPKPFRH